MKPLLAGLDVSTQSAKLVILDASQEKVIHADSVNYDNDLPHFRTLNGVIQNQPEGVSESDPKMWLEAVELLFSRLGAYNIPAGRIQCISVSGQQHGLVCLDEKGELTRKTAKLWNDVSTVEECDFLTEAVSGSAAMIDEVGNTQRPGYTASKILHFKRHEAVAFEQTQVFLLVHNYINHWLTGGISVMEPGDVSGMALWHPGSQKWSDKVINAIDPDLMRKLPPVLPSDATIGYISEELVSRYGFSPSCRIDAGSGDNMYGAIGTGNIEEGIVTVSLGTSGTAFSFSKEAFIDPVGEIAAFCDATGHHLPLLCVSNMAGGYNRLLNRFHMTHQQFVEVVSATPPGNCGRLVIPWYEGERTPDLPQAAPVYLGFGVDEFNQEYLCRGVLEGHVLNIYDGFRRMPVKAREIRLTGGLSQSPAWRQTIADVFEAEVVPVKGEGAALGAAIHAAWVWMREAGHETSLESLCRVFVVLDESCRHLPKPDAVEAHRQQKALFRSLSQRLRGLEGDDPFRLRHQWLHST